MTEKTLTPYKQEEKKLLEVIGSYNIPENAKRYGAEFERRRDSAGWFDDFHRIELIHQKEAVDALQSLTEEQAIYTIGSVASAMRKRSSSGITAVVSFIVGAATILLAQKCTSDQPVKTTEKAPTAKVRPYNIG